MSIYNLRMFSKVFEKGEEWLDAYEKYLKNGKIPLELTQMKLNEDEEILAQRVEQQHLVQLQLQQQLQLALSIFQLDFNVLNQLWHISNKARDILAQRDLTLPIETQQRQLPATELAIERVNGKPSDILIAELFQLQQAIREYKAVWPPRLVVLLRFLSDKLMMTRRFILFHREAQRFLQLTQ